MPAKPPLSMLPSAIPCKRGDTLTAEQYRRVFPGMQAFVQHLASLHSSQNSTNHEAATHARESA